MTNEKLDTLITLMLKNLPEDDQAQLLAEAGVVVAGSGEQISPDFNAKFWARIRREDAELAAAKEAESPREPAKARIHEQPRLHLRKEE